LLPLFFPIIFEDSRKEWEVLSSGPFIILRGHPIPLIPFHYLKMATGGCGVPSIIETAKERTLRPKSIKEMRNILMSRVSKPLGVS